ncbi:unnamed protein product [Closterium sp. Yama58-4]|nr:unnamed protein product [Closterium sp. Yama58-4]
MEPVLAIPVMANSVTPQTLLMADHQGEEHEGMADRRGGLAHGSKEKKPRRKVQWDEGNLTYNEEHKSATMTIDEPKTPFHQLSLDPEEAAALSPVLLPAPDPSHSIAAQADVIQAKLAEIAATSSADSACDKADFERWMHERGQTLDPDTFRANAGGEGGSEGGGTGEEDFEEHRRRHYDEFKRVKELLAKGALDDDEEEEDKGQGEEGGEGKAQML